MNIPCVSGFFSELVGVVQFLHRERRHRVLWLGAAVFGVVCCPFVLSRVHHKTLRTRVQRTLYWPYMQLPLFTCMCYEDWLALGLYASGVLEPTEVAQDVCDVLSRLSVFDRTYRSLDVFVGDLLGRVIFRFWLSLRLVVKVNVDCSV